MQTRYRVILVVVVALILSFIFYLLESKQSNQHNYREREGEYVRIIERMIVSTLKEEVYITEQERNNTTVWKQLFEQYGERFSVETLSFERIPNDNSEIHKLLPPNAKPSSFEKDDSAFYISYTIGSKRYYLAYYDAGNRVVKSIYLLQDNPDNTVKYMNENNEKYTPTVSVPFYRK
ncbi:hypothetical protein [Cohnella abietis]|uniref:Uncharacterized protein n=1 Tax=Cohnella abietis TaxID=2507935 RepID=A0A3T1CZX6_9BACL|nr:hypothetical protein [Cohnella abietis]BBI31319.1 hypothetical protein KCTCHS21_07180 [Cohnella abietis]